MLCYVMLCYVMLSIFSMFSINKTHYMIFYYYSHAVCIISYLSRWHLQLEHTHVLCKNIFLIDHDPNNHPMSEGRSDGPLNRTIFSAFLSKGRTIFSTFLSKNEPFSLLSLQRTDHFLYFLL